MPLEVERSNESVRRTVQRAVDLRIKHERKKQLLYGTVGFLMGIWTVYLSQWLF